MCEQEALNLIPVFEKFRLVPKDKKLWNPYGIIYPIRGSLSQTRWCFSWENDGLSNTEVELTWLPGGKYTSLAHSCHVTCFSQWYRRQYNATHIQAEIVELAFLPFISFFLPLWLLNGISLIEVVSSTRLLGREEGAGSGLQERDDQRQTDTMRSWEKIKLLEATEVLGMFVKQYKLLGTN